MSNFQNLVVATTQSGPSNQSLTGCMYQVVQNPGAQGKNVLQLIPVFKTKDNPVPLTPVPVTANTPGALQQPVKLPLPPAASTLPLSLPENAKLVQQLGSANYIITTQKNPADVSKTIRVDGHPHTAVVVDQPPLNLKAGPQRGAPSFIIMNAKPGSFPVRTIPLFPAGHGLQIPPHAEMKSIPASSLPFSIQQKILPPTSGNDGAKIPSVIYVSPVNATRTSHSPVTAAARSPILTPVLVPAVQPEAAPPQGPLKWVVQENTESVVPVKSTSETASKFFTLMSGAKAEEASSPASNFMQIKDNTLVMCNNKLYFLTKQKGQFRSPVQIKQESPEKPPPPPAEQASDLANKVVEVVLSKNNLSSPNSKQTSNSATPPLIASPPKSCTPPTASKNVPEVIYIDDDDDDAANIQKPQSVHPPGETNSTRVYTPSNLIGSDNQVTAKESEMAGTTKSPVARVTDDRTLRARFGLFKQEKIVLSRIPLLRPQGKSDPRDASDDVAVHAERPSDFSESPPVSKRRKSSDDSGFSITSVTTDFAGDYWRSPSPPPPPAGFSDFASERTRTSPSPTATSAAYGHPSTSHRAQGGPPGMYTDPSDSQSFYAGQDITGHFSEAPLPRQRFHIESPAYPDETTKDEKIQRLKEVLKEREQALEALRRQKWSQ